MPAFDVSLFLLGCLGGILPDLLRFIRNRNKLHMPAYFSKATFWLGVILLVGVGGLTAWVLTASTAKDALLYGYASPQILSQLAAGVQTARAQRGGSDTSGRAPVGVLTWWGS
jgi:hypothetical protein